MPFAANDRIRIGTIGAGGMGTGDTRNALSLPGMELAAVSDVYDGRLLRARERFGDGLFTTRDYREILDRRDIDVIIIATPDHWHARITREALAAGKDVYCQKPMVRKIDEGKPVIEAERASGRILQIGSQYVSSLVYAKARQLLKAGSIGEVNLVEAWLDRNTALGAWQYSIPPDASPETVDWDRFLGHAPERPFEAIRLFRWRNYRDYGTGVAGDLFVHLLSGLHYAMDSLGPVSVYATGGLRYWNDGRDVPDVMLALLDYPETPQHAAFHLSLRVNLASGGVAESFGFRFVGSEGVMTTGMTSVSLSKRERRRNSDNLRQETEEVFTVPPGYDAHLEHHRNFLAAVRSRKPFIEDGTFGFRAAGPALLTNISFDEGRLRAWDPHTMSATE